MLSTLNAQNLKRLDVLRKIKKKKRDKKRCDRFKLNLFRYNDDDDDLFNG